MGMDIIQQCEVKGVRSENGQVTGVETTKGFIGTKKLGIVVAGHSGQVAEMAGFRLPIEAVALQALVSRTDQALHGRGRDGQHRARLHVASPTRARW